MPWSSNLLELATAGRRCQPAHGLAVSRGGGRFGHSLGALGTGRTGGAGRVRLLTCRWSGDAVLIERVLVNLLESATATYGARS